MHLPGETDSGNLGMRNLSHCHLYSGYYSRPPFIGITLGPTWLWCHDRIVCFAYAQCVPLRIQDNDLDRACAQVNT